MHNPVNFQPDFEPCWGEEREPDFQRNKWRDRVVTTMWVLFFIGPLPVMLTLLAGYGLYEIFS